MTNTALERWLTADRRRTAVLCQATYNGVWCWCCILRQPINDPMMIGSKSIHVSSAYKPTLDEAIQAAIEQTNNR